MSAGELLKVFLVVKRPIGVSKDALVHVQSVDVFSLHTWTCEEFLSSLSVQLCITEDSSLEAFQVLSMV